MDKPYKEIALSAIPAIFFLLTYRYVSYRAAIVVGFTLAFLVFTYKYRINGRLRAIDKIVIYGLIIQSIMGLMSENQQVYFLYPLIQNFIITILFFASLFLSEDASSYLAKDFIKSDKIMKLMRPTYRRLTLIWGFYFLIKVIIRVFGLMYWSFERLYIVSWLLGTPVSVLLLLFSFAYPQKIYEKISKID